MTRFADLGWRAAGAVFVVFLVSPLALVVIFSFTDRTLTNFPMSGVSLRWWREMFEHRQFADALTNSLIIGVSVGIASSMIGTLAAIGLNQLPHRRSQAAMAALCLPLMLPPLVLAVSLLTFYVEIGLRPNLHTVILSHLLFTQPFVILVVHARLASFDYRVVESARDMGASPIQAFFTVTLPIIRPTIIGAALVAVALSFDDFIITFFTIGSGNTLPTLVWGMIRTGLTPMVNAIGTLIILITIGSILAALALTKYRG